MDLHSCRTLPSPLSASLVQPARDLVFPELFSAHVPRPKKAPRKTSRPQILHTDFSSPLPWISEGNLEPLMVPLSARYEKTCGARTPTRERFGSSIGIE